MMAQDNSCLKTLCITFSVLYGILGVIFLFIGILASSYKNEFEECNMEKCMLICCSIGSVMVTLALLGSFGVHKEKKWALRVYTAFLVLHTAGCVPVLHSLLSVHTKVNNDALRQLTPLNRADGRIQKAINKMQTVYRIQDNHGKSVEVYKQVISTILHLVLFCQDREQIHTRSWRSCEDATLPPYKGLHEGAAL
ncbi:hypothetical protein JZ751_011516 [Albula glossodonta]|uniref:Uncharacterized protein n=1 Tax=Albula glossodonta TaxID=121402 RepID=A0A8T2MZA3_9TELE|nr:hypothetical protein JZ751_011516 [Albula glossodonta]